MVLQWQQISLNPKRFSSLRTLQPLRKLASFVRPRLASLGVFTGGIVSPYF